MGREHLAARAHLIVCYDGACGLCAVAVERLRTLDEDGRLLFVPGHRVAIELPDVAVRLDPNALSSALHVVEDDGSWISGGEAVLRIAETIPRLRPIAWLGRLPLIDLLVEPLYRLVARHRHRLSRILGQD